MLQIIIIQLCKANKQYWSHSSNNNQYIKARLNISLCSCYRHSLIHNWTGGILLLLLLTIDVDNNLAYMLCSVRFVREVTDIVVLFLHAYKLRRPSRCAAQCSAWSVILRQLDKLKVRRSAHWASDVVIRVQLCKLIALQI